MPPTSRGAQMSADGASNRRQEEQGGRVAIGLSGAESVGDEADGDDGNGSQRSRRASLDRRALVRSAMDGLNRFKQSWISVMLLKAGIGLGQVIILIVLLILAAILPSPLDETRTQTQSSPQCPHPQLFQSWMAVQIVRLTTCWGVSCWMLVRNERARRARVRRASRAEDGMVGVREDAAVSDSRSANDAPRRTPPSTSPPSLSHSASTRSTATFPRALGHTNSASSSPLTSPINIASASASASRLELPIEMEELSSPHRVRKSRVGALVDGAAVPVSGVTGLLPVITAVEPVQPSRAISGERTADENVGIRPRSSTRSLRRAREMARRRSVEGGREGVVREEQDGEAEADDDDDVASDNPSQRKGFAGWLDRSAMSISRCLGGISLVLFVLGNVLLFHPIPADNTCYSASPLLWWGVMTVTAVGYLLFAQIFFVVVIVGLGGAVVLNALRRLGVLPAPPEPEPPRPPQPDPLTPDELRYVKIVCYVPLPAPAPVPAPTELSATPEHAEVDPTRLPYPPAYLGAYQNTCVICQEAFKVPFEGRTVLLKAEPLRQLPCAHVYHLNCIDEWLLKGAGNCPSCNRPVRQDGKVLGASAVGDRAGSMSGAGAGSGPRRESNFGLLGVRR